MPVRDHYPAALSAAVHCGNAGDLAFYRQACAGVRTVLELGCGNGRVGAIVAASGADVVGLDVNIDALAAARRRGLACVAADMRNFCFQQRFERILIPYNGLYCLLSDDDVVACLSNARRHLAQGGQIIFDGYAVNASARPGARSRRTSSSSQLTTIEVGGRTWDVFEDNVMWPATRRIDAHYRYVPRDGGTTLSAAIRQRYLAAAEVPALLSRAGLMLVSLQGGFRGETFTVASEHVVVRAAVSH
jgi:SAM-dependent methyltransferase